MIRTVTLILLIGFALTFQACVHVQPPPQEMVTRGDHGGLASHYTREVTALRQKAVDWDALADFYEKHPFPHGKLEHKGHAAHCRAIATAYRKAADEAQVLADYHRRELSEVRQ